jgi:hypothetical protein
MPFRWQKEHRFVAVRRAAALEPESIQQRLFTFKQYTYHQALVTNLEPTAAAVWRFYCDRGFQELLLREFKGCYTMAKIPTRSFWANAAYMEMVLWSYDLVLAFQYLCLPEEVRNWNIATLRPELWWLPAEWVRRTIATSWYCRPSIHAKTCSSKFSRLPRKSDPLFKPVCNTCTASSLVGMKISRYSGTPLLQRDRLGVLCGVGEQSSAPDRSIMKRDKARNILIANQIDKLGLPWALR